VRSIIRVAKKKDKMCSDYVGSSKPKKERKNVYRNIRKSLGDCEHARDVVLTRASMTCVARALSVLVSFVWYLCVCAHVCTCVYLVIRSLSF